MNRDVGGLVLVASDCDLCENSRLLFQKVLVIFQRLHIFSFKVFEQQKEFEIKKNPFKIDLDSIQPLQP